MFDVQGSNIYMLYVCALALSWIKSECVLSVAVCILVYGSVQYS